MSDTIGNHINMIKSILKLTPNIKWQEKGGKLIVSEYVIRLERMENNLIHFPFWKKSAARWQC